MVHRKKKLSPKCAIYSWFIYWNVSSFMYNVCWSLTSASDQILHVQEPIEMGAPVEMVLVDSSRYVIVFPWSNSSSLYSLFTSLTIIKLLWSSEKLLLISASCEASLEILGKWTWSFQSVNQMQMYTFLNPAIMFFTYLLLDRCQRHKIGRASCRERVCLYV